MSWVFVTTSTPLSPKMSPILSPVIPSLPWTPLFLPLSCSFLLIHAQLWCCCFVAVVQKWPLAACSVHHCQLIYAFGMVYHCWNWRIGLGCRFGRFLRRLDPKNHDQIEKNLRVLLYEILSKSKGSTSQQYSISRDVIMATAVCYLPSYFPTRGCCDVWQQLCSSSARCSRDRTGRIVLQYRIRIRIHHNIGRLGLGCPAFLQRLLGTLLMFLADGYRHTQSRKE